MGDEEEEHLNIEKMNAEDVLEYLYEISDKYKDKKDPVESMKEDLRTMIRTFKEDKFDKIQKELRVDP